MNGTLILSIGSTLLSFFTILLLVMPSRRSQLDPISRSVFLILLLLTFATSLSNVLEWSGLAPQFDAYEDYSELLLPVIWVFLFISFLQAGNRRKLKLSEERYRTISELTSDYIYSVQVTKEGEFTNLWLGGAFERITGHPPNKVRSYEEWLALIHEEDRAESSRSLKDSLDNRVTRVEYRLQRPDGRTLWLRDIHHPVFNNKQSRVVRIIGAVQNISESKKKSDELLQTEDRLNRAQALAHVGNWEIDLQTGTMWGSSEAFRIYGLPRRTEFLPLTYVQSAVHSEDRQRLDIAMQDAMEKDALYDVEFRIFRFNDRSLRHMHSQAVIVRNPEGEPVKVAGTVQDITERRLLEQQYYHAQRMEAIGQFASGVAHDINNLITAINGNAELARLELLERDDEKTVESLDEILHAADRISSLNSRLLAFSRKSDQQRVQLNINSVVVSLEKMLRRILGEEIVLETRLVREELLANADVSHLEQVIMNLVVNARDAMPGGGRIVLQTFACTVEKEQGVGGTEQYSGEYVVMSIRDNGVGMSKEVQQKIFEPFFTTKESGQGTGLGLATVIGVIKQLEGFVKVDSTPGEGTEFQILLPRISGEPSTIPSEAGIELSHHGEESILIVEDDEMVRNLSANILRNHGYEVFVSANGAEALAHAQHMGEKLHLVLTDVVMPMLRGPEMVEKLRLRWPELKVIYMSGYAAHTSGMIEPDDHFIEKPFTVQTLTKKVREVLDSER